jgi:hypothetical protein
MKAIRILFNASLLGLAIYAAVMAIVTLNDVRNAAGM